MRTVARLRQMMPFVGPSCYLRWLGESMFPSKWRYCASHYDTREVEKL